MINRRFKQEYTQSSLSDLIWDVKCGVQFSFLDEFSYDCQFWKHNSRRKEAHFQALLLRVSLCWGGWGVSKIGRDVYWPCVGSTNQSRISSESLVIAIIVLKQVYLLKPLPCGQPLCLPCLVSRDLLYLAGWVDGRGRIARHYSWYSGKDILGTVPRPLCLRCSLF